VNEIKASAGSGGPRRRKADDEGGTDYDFGVLSGRVESLEKSVDNLNKSVTDSSSEIAVMRTTMSGVQETITGVEKRMGEGLAGVEKRMGESLTKLEVSVAGHLQKLIDAQTDGWTKTLRDAVKNDAWARRLVVLAFLGVCVSIAMTVNYRLFGKDAAEAGADAARSLKGSQTEMVEDFLPADEVAQPSE
jgi:prophage DNA circulation protein